ncbi:MAG: TIGR03084 family protein [Actinobacteria bacterium]|nr:TIGR03084 family protein [Actinomycetota bacterium]
MTQQPDPTGALTAECDELDALLTGLTDEQWQLPTPAPGWTIAHQVAHLAATFKMAGLSASDPDGFVALMARLDNDFTVNVANALSEYLSDPPEVLFGRWQAERNAAVKALSSVPGDQPVPWLVNPLPPAVLMMAGMMEAFAHGQDIADALGVRPVRTDRIGFLVAFAVRTWNFGYLARNEPTPDVEFRYELTAPSGAVWQYGPENASQRITGPAEDFCLLVTRRRHRDDLAITAVGKDAEHWLDIAQAYRGPAGEGRQPGQFAG